MRNRFGGKCYRCGEWVAPGEGHFEKVRGSRPVRWLTQHANCAIEHRGSDVGRGSAVGLAYFSAHKCAKSASDTTDNDLQRPDPAL